MRFARFLLDEWLERYKDKGIRYDLATSTGPVWTLGELLALGDAEERRAFEATRLLYAHAQGSEELRSALAEVHGVSADDVLLTTGAEEALHILFFTVAAEGKNVVVPAPGFPPTRVLPEGLGLEVREYRLRPESGFRVDFDEVRKLVDSRTAVVVACSPHNPTGAVLSADEQQQLHDLAVERGALFVSDEVYRPLFFGPAVPTAAALPQGIVAGDFSKALSLSGLRLGWLIERDAARREEFLRARTYFTISGSPVTESLALLALRHRDVILGKAAETCRRNLAALETFADLNSDLFGFVAPKGGTVSFPWLTFTDDSRPFCEAAAREGVLLAPGDTFGEPRHFRLGFGAVPYIEEALPVLEGVLRRFAAERIGIASARA